jgi:hypothetical protein
VKVEKNTGQETAEDRYGILFRGFSSLNITSESRISRKRLKFLVKDTGLKLSTVQYYMHIFRHTVPCNLATFKIRIERFNEHLDHLKDNMNEKKSVVVIAEKKDTKILSGDERQRIVFDELKIARRESNGNLCNGECIKIGKKAGLKTTTVRKYQFLLKRYGCRTLEEFHRAIKSISQKKEGLPHEDTMVRKHAVVPESFEQNRLKLAENSSHPSHFPRILSFSDYSLALIDTALKNVVETKGILDKSIMQTLKFTWERDICWTDVCVELLRKSDAISAYYGVKNEFRMVKSLTSTDTCISYMVRP